MEELNRKPVRISPRSLTAKVHTIAPAVAIALMTLDFEEGRATPIASINYSSSDDAIIDMLGDRAPALYIVHVYGSVPSEAPHIILRLMTWMERATGHRPRWLGCSLTQGSQREDAIVILPPKGIVARENDAVCLTLMRAITSSNSNALAELRSLGQDS